MDEAAVASRNGARLLLLETGKRKRPLVEERKSSITTEQQGIRVYTRTLRPNECMKNSRKVGPNFPSLFKKARKSQLRRPSPNFDKFLALVCVTPTSKSGALVELERPLCVLHWVIRKKRSKKKKKKSITKTDSLSHVLQFSEDFLRLSGSIKTQLAPACVKVQELIDNDGHTDSEMLDAFDMLLPQHISKDSNDEEISVNQHYDFYKEAMFDFSVRMMDGLHIDDVSSDLSSQMVDGLHSNKKDVSNDFSGRKIEDASNQWNQIVVHKDKTVSSEESQPPPNAKAKVKKPPKAKAKVKKPPKAKAKKSSNEGEREMVVSSKNSQPPPKAVKEKTKKKTPKTEEVDQGQLNKFESDMKLVQGEEWHFSPPCEGSVVDYVVGLYLIQKCKDVGLTPSDAFVGFMNLKSRFRVVSDGVTDYTIQDTQLLRIAERPFDEVVPEQFPMVEKEGPSGSSHTEVGSEDGNVNFSQTGKQDTSSWGELCVKQTTPKKRTGCNRDSIDWNAVRETSYTELAVILMKRTQRNQLAGTIKDFLNRMVKDHGSIDLEWLRDIRPEEANEHLLSIPCLCLKKTVPT